MKTIIIPNKRKENDVIERAISLAIHQKNVSISDMTYRTNKTESQIRENIKHINKLEKEIYEINQYKTSRESVKKILAQKIKSLKGTIELTTEVKIERMEHVAKNKEEIEKLEKEINELSDELAELK